VLFALMLLCKKRRGGKDEVVRVGSAESSSLSAQV